MTIEIFETEKANYIANFGNHFTRTDPSLSESIDALVVETGVNKGDRALEILLMKKTNVHFDELIEKCISKRIPIYAVDIPPDCSRINKLKNELEILLTIPTGFIPVIYGFSNIKMNDFLAKLHSNYLYFMQFPRLEGRNAINAKKIEEFVVDRVNERLAYKPTIGLVYGANHIGLKYDLLCKERRDKTIETQRKKEFRGLDQTELNKVYALNLENNTWYLKTFTTKLFQNNGEK